MAQGHRRRVTDRDASPEGKVLKHDQDPASGNLRTRECGLEDRGLGDTRKAWSTRLLERQTLGSARAHEELGLQCAMHRGYQDRNGR